MKVYIELWKATDAWHALSTEERGNYMTQLGPAIAEMAAKGMEIVNWGANDPDTDNRADYDFWSVMKFPNSEQVKSFEQTVTAAGWYNYFSQINVCGDGTSPENVIGKLIAL